MLARSTISLTILGSGFAFTPSRCPRTSVNCMEGKKWAMSLRVAAWYLLEATASFIPLSCNKANNSGHRGMERCDPCYADRNASRTLPLPLVYSLPSFHLRVTRVRIICWCRFLRRSYTPLRRASENRFAATHGSCYGLNRRSYLIMFRQDRILLTFHFSFLAKLMECRDILYLSTDKIDEPI